MGAKKIFGTRLLTWALAAILTVLVVIMAAACFFFSAPVYRGPATDHFDGRRFFNQAPVERHRFTSFLKWIWTRKTGPWMPFRNAAPGPKPPERVSGKDLRVTFVNHSTVLIQIDGLNILIDPVWSLRIGPVSWYSPRRHIPPGIRFEDLPPIDFVLISHNHYDHLDLPTLKRLAQIHKPRFLTGQGNRKILQEAGIDNVHDLDWWDQVEAKDQTKIFFVPSRHFSSRSFCDHDRTLWGGFVITDPAGVIYFASDTGMGPHFGEIKKRFGSPRLAMLPIGAYLPRWFMSPMHLSPEEALDVHDQLGAGTSMPIHFGTFKLGDDGQFEAQESLARANVDRSITNFWILKPGEGRNVE